MNQGPYRTRDEVVGELNELDPKNITDGEEIEWALYVLIEIRAAISRGDLDQHLDALTSMLERKRLALTTHSVGRRVLAGQSLAVLALLVSIIAAVGRRELALLFVGVVPAIIKTIIDLARHARRELVALSIGETIALARARTPLPQLPAPSDNASVGAYSVDEKEPVKR